MNTSTDFIAGGGTMGALMRGFDWSLTPLGPVEEWPQSLRTSVSICLNSRFPIIIFWGPQLILLYNDAYMPIPGAKHPAALGQAAEDCWSEIWDIVGPMLNSVLRDGSATWSVDQMLPLHRSGYTEECYFTFSYSPIRGENGEVGGVFTAVTDTTQKVLSERRLQTLRNLGYRAVGVDDTIVSAVGVLRENPYDIPFALLYLHDVGRGEFRLAGSTGIEVEAAPQPSAFSLSELPRWAAGFTGREAFSIDDVPGHFGTVSSPVWPEPVEQALVIPLGNTSEKDSPLGWLVTGISPRRELDSEYRSFLELVAGQLATLITTARTFEAEKARAQELAKLNQAKTDFFNNISHEFRTPITLMLGPLEDLLGMSTSDDVSAPRQTLELVHRNGLRLLKLVNTLLDFSRLEAGRMDAVFEPTELGAYTSDLASVFRSAAERAGLAYIVDCPALREITCVDRDMWEKIVLNLISNAIKFTISGEVRVSLSQSAGITELTVQDTGCGIPPSELPHIFERFHRVRGTASRTFEGTGIGLALVRELTELHGGNVSVESEAGGGCVFRVSIPAGPRSTGTDTPKTADLLGGPSRVSQAFATEASQWSGETSDPLIYAAPSAVRAHDGKRAILVVDDNADLRLYLQALLEPDYIVRVAADGLEALEEVRTDPPDLILSDVMMPHLDGLGLVERLRAEPRTRSIPVILLSARAGENSEILGLESGADDYLVKPFSNKELRARVASHLKMSEIRREAEMRQRGIAETLQRSLLRVPASSDFPGLSFACHYQPAGDEAAVGGDFFDVFPLPGGFVAFLVGDVTGKGLRAATFTAELKFALRAYLHEDPTPASSVTRLNGYLANSLRWDGQTYDTVGSLAVGVIHPGAGHVRMANAGSESPLILPAGGAAYPVELRGPVLGAVDDFEFDEITLAIAPGDTILLTTDGITEARRGGDFYGYERFRSSAGSASAAGGPEEIARAVVQAASDFAAGAFRDDVCVLAMQRSPLGNRIEPPEA